MTQISKTITSKKEVISIFNGPAFTQRIVDDVFSERGDGKEKCNLIIKEYDRFVLV